MVLTARGRDRARQSLILTTDALRIGAATLRAPAADGRRRANAQAWPGAVTRRPAALPAVEAAACQPQRATLFSRQTVFSH